MIEWYSDCEVKKIFTLVTPPWRLLSWSAMTTVSSSPTMTLQRHLQSRTISALLTLDLDLVLILPFFVGSSPNLVKIGRVISPENFPWAPWSQTLKNWITPVPAPPVLSVPGQNKLLELLLTHMPLYWSLTVTNWSANGELKQYHWVLSLLIAQ